MTDLRAAPLPHGHWNAESLWQALLPLLPGLSVEVLARCPSTNTLLLERARQASGSPPAAPRGDPAAQAQPPMQALARVPGQVPGPRGRRAGDVAPTLLVAEHQTDGRGRLGRQWQAAPGAALTFSLALPLAPHAAGGWSGLSLAVGLALADALEPQPAHPAPRVQLKWPNDLWLCGPRGPGRKLGGVLIETVATGPASSAAPSTAAGPRMAVVGVGLNVAPQALQGLSSGYACVQELLPGVTAPALLRRVAAPLVRALLAFQHQGFAPLAEAYGRRDLLRGQAVSTTLADLPHGVAEGVDDDGALRVRAGGVLQRVSSGEVSIRLQPAASRDAAAAQAAEERTAERTDASSGESAGQEAANGAASGPDKDRPC